MADYYTVEGSKILDVDRYLQWLNSRIDHQFDSIRCLLETLAARDAEIAECERIMAGYVVGGKTLADRLRTALDGLQAKLRDALLELHSSQMAQFTAEVAEEEKHG